MGFGFPKASHAHSETVCQVLVHPTLLPHLVECFLFVFQFSQEILVHPFMPPAAFIGFLHNEMDYSHTWRWWPLNKNSATCPGHFYSPGLICIGFFQAGPLTSFSPETYSCDTVFSLFPPLRILRSPSHSHCSQCCPWPPLFVHIRSSRTCPFFSPSTTCLRKLSSMHSSILMDCLCLSFPADINLFKVSYSD